MMIIIFLGLLSLLSNNVDNVSALSIDSFYDGDWIPQIWISKRKPNGYTEYLQAHFILRASDGAYVYCVEPWQELIDTVIYGGTSDDPTNAINISKDQWRRVSLIAYYGYGYGNHTDSKWYAISQVMIWRTIDPQSDVYFTNGLNGSKLNDKFLNEINEIENLISQHYISPNFGGNRFDVSLNQTFELYDTNSMLSKYDIVSNNNITINSKTDNQLIVTPTQIGTLTLTLENSDKLLSTPPIVYADPNSQDIMVKGKYDPISMNLTFNVLGGKIKIKKVDREINDTIPQGQATLKGAVYNVFDSNNNLVTNLTIGDDGTATTDFLPFGIYTIREKSASTGYYLDTNVYTVNVNSTDITEVTVQEDVIKGKIQIKKVDKYTNTCTSQGQATLVGAKYGIYDWNNNLVETLIIGNDCSAISEPLPYGNYHIEEISAPTGYKLDTKVYDANIPNDITIMITSEEDVIKGRIQINKVDSETKLCNAQGQATLIGAKYGIYDWNNNLVETLIIGNDCSAISEPLPYGNYKIKELEATDGYYISTKVYSQFITEEINYFITDEEEAVKNYISILKQYNFVNGNTTFLDAESGIIFEIYYPNGELYDTIVTDKHGYATIDLPYGIWKFHQVNTNDNFEKIYDFNITVNKDSEKEQYYNILNNKLSAYLQVVKVDSETKETIAIENTTFKILNVDTNEFVSQYVGGKVYSEFKTDKEGKFVTYLKLDAGNYKLVEIANPNGYLIDQNGIEFSIGSDTQYTYTEYGVFVTIIYENTPIKGVIEINKKGEKVVVENGKYKYEQIPLDGVVFEVYANEDILSSDKKVLHYKKGQLVDTITTNEYGYAKSKELYLGNYYLVEIKTKDSHVLNPKKYEFVLSEVDNRTPIVYHTYNDLNMLKKGIFEFTKEDLSTGKVIPNTKIEIYHIKDDGTSELVFDGITNQDGKIIITDLFIGKFSIIETDSATGYKLSDEIVTFEIKENGEIVKAIMKNEKIKGTLEFTKIDFSTSESLPNTLIEIYDAETEKLIYSERTDENGKIIVENLSYGKYYIIEKEAPNGYILNEEKMYFEIKEDGEIVKVTMKNEKVEMPNTYNTDIPYLVKVVLIIILGIGLLIYAKKK